MTIVLPVPPQGFELTRSAVSSAWTVRISRRGNIQPLDSNPNNKSGSSPFFYYPLIKRSCYRAIPMIVFH